MNTGKLKAIALTGAVAIVLLALSVIFYIVIAGKDISTTAPVIIGFAAPTVTTLFAYAGLQNSVTSIKEDVKNQLAPEQPKVTEVNSDNQHHN